MKLNRDVRRLTQQLLDVFGFEGKAREHIVAIDLRLAYGHVPTLKIEYAKHEMAFENEQREGNADEQRKD